MLRVRAGVVAVTLVGVLALLGGCAAENYNAQTYRTGLSAQRVELGTIIAIRNVALQPDNAGGTVGTIAGGILGSQLGGESDSFVLHGLGALGGAVIGGMVGQSTGNQMTGSVGELITVRLDSGRMVAVTQKAGQGLRVGQKVQVLYGRNGETRVFPF
jgi:outer membrane lipoprotein SlyB